MDNSFDSHQSSLQHLHLNVLGHYSSILTELISKGTKDIKLSNLYCFDRWRNFSCR